MNLLNIEKWAFFYHHFDHKNTDTNMLVERYCFILVYVVHSYLCQCSFHNKLKTNPWYLNHNVNGRCDDLIEVLLLLEKDMFCNRKRMELFSSPGDISIRLDGSRHTRGDAIPDSYVYCKVYALYFTFSCL